MKYLVVLCDGMADYPVEELGNKTPLEAADTPWQRKQPLVWLRPCRMA